MLNLIRGKERDITGLAVRRRCCVVKGEVLLRGGVVVVKKYSCHSLKHTKHVTCVELLGKKWPPH